MSPYVSDCEHRAPVRQHLQRVAAVMRGIGRSPEAHVGRCGEGRDEIKGGDEFGCGEYLRRCASHGPRKYCSRRQHEIRKMGI
jgi:hypothetical protein